VAAVLFALEEIIGDMNAGLIGSTVVASVTSVIVERAILGDEVLFRVPTYQLAHPAELLAYVLLGIVGGFVSVLFCKSLLKLRAFFLKLPASTAMFQPAVGGLAIGIILIFVPQVMGVGYEYVDQALNGGLLLKTMVLLCLVKLGATVVSYSTGNAGGIFAPSLYLGAMAGGVVGQLVHQHAPFPTAAPGAYALVGMGTLFAGIVRAPMTSVFMIFELTQDYQILVPLMTANMLSFLISRRFQHAPVYHALLEQSHIYLPGPEMRPENATRVRSLMNTDVRFVPPSTSIADAQRVLADDHSDCCLIGDRSHLVGVLTMSSLKEAISSGRETDSVQSIAIREFEHLYPDQPVDIALERLSRSGHLLPVLSRSGNRRVEGVIGIDSILKYVGRQPA
jgi:CIC family chloride channel protein